MFITLNFSDQNLKSAKDMKDGEEAFLGETVNFDSGYRIGIHMQSRWENYCRIFADLSQFLSERFYFMESIFLNGILI